MKGEEQTGMQGKWKGKIRVGWLLSSSNQMWISLDELDIGIII